MVECVDLSKICVGIRGAISKMIRYGFARVKNQSLKRVRKKNLKTDS
jgi:hypothetical protein